MSTSQDIAPYTARLSLGEDPITMAYRTDEGDNKPPTTLTDLPEELLIPIASLLDQPTSLALALVCRRLTHLAVPQIWRFINLSPDSLLAPTSDAPADAGGVVHKIPKGEKEGRRHTVAVRGKVNAILAMTDVEPRLLGMVEDVRFRNLPGAVPYMMTLLERVSSTIRGLTIDPLRDPRTSTSRQPIADILQLELHLLDRPISFSRLTCVQIAPYTTLFAHVLVPLLCAASPNLISLDVGPQHHADLPGEGWVPSPRLAADTSLQRLKLCLPDVDFEYEPLEVWESAMGQLLDVLSRSSNLRQLSVHPGDWLMHYHETLWERAVECCEKHPHLHDVHWEADLNEAEHYFQDFRGLKRLVLSAGSPLDLFVPPRMPTLETLIIYTRTVFASEDHCAPGPLDSLDTCTPPTFAKAMHLCSALNLHGSAYLTSIYYVGKTVDMSDLGLFTRLDAVQGGETCIGRVSSICHGETELLYARFYTPWTEDGDDLYNPCEWHISVDRRYVTDLGDNNIRVHRFFRRQETAEWRAYTDFEGLAVPLALIERMREVEGASEEEWQARGVQVGEVAWRVLLDWQETVLRGVRSDQACA